MIVKGAEFLVLWTVLSLIIGIPVAAFFHHGNPTDEIAATDLRLWEQEAAEPPEYEPDDGESLRIAELFADAARELDQDCD